MEEASPENPAPAPRRWVFAHRGFNLLFFGSFAGKLAERFYQMAVLVAVMKAFKDTLNQFALITLAGVIPQFVFYPLIGKLIDSLDRRRLLWGTCALSAAVVWSLLPVLWSDPKAPEFAERWHLALLAIFALSLILVPFGPARVSAIPDVVTAEETDLAASIVATSGLAAILVGSLLGGFAADRWGSGLVIPLACGLYVLAAVLLRALPDRVAVPGTRREATAQVPEPAAAPARGLERLRAYARENWAGVRYCLGTRGVVALILFEATFWLCAVSYYNLCDWHASLVLNLPESTRVFLFSAGLGCAGVGLFLGALTVGRFCRQASPLLTYPLAYFLVGLAMWCIFSSRAPAQPEAALDDYLEHHLSVVVKDALPEKEAGPFTVLADSLAGRAERREKLAEFALPALSAARRAELEVLLPEYQNTPENAARARRVAEWLAAQQRIALGLFPFLFLLGLGGGLLLGRIDADVLAIVEPAMRGRVFSLKGFFFTGALLLPLLLFWRSQSYDTRAAVAHFVPPLLMCAAFPVLALSWMVDAGIYAKQERIGPAGVQERAAFWTARFIAWLLYKTYNRITVEGVERVPKTGPLLLAANHGSFLDPVWLGIMMPRRVQYIMHAAYYRSWAHPFFRFMNCIPVDEQSPLKALKTGAQALAQGICIGMFPEGHVSSDGQLQKPLAGALFLAQRGGATVVPVAIAGNVRAFPRGAGFPRPYKIVIRVGKPFQVPKEARREEVAQLTDRVMAEIAGMLRVDPPPACADELKDRRKGGSGSTALRIEN